jgi:hypothetical protein
MALVDCVINLLRVSKGVLDFFPFIHCGRRTAAMNNKKEHIEFRSVSMGCAHGYSKGFPLQGKEKKVGLIRRYCGYGSTL